MTRAAQLTALALATSLFGCSGPSAPPAVANRPEPVVVAPAQPAAEHLVRIDGTLSIPGVGDCGGGPGFRTGCPGRCVRVAVFERDGAFFAGRVESSGARTPGAPDPCSIAAAEASATPIARDRVAQMERVIAGVDLFPSISPYETCPKLTIRTSTRTVEAGGCLDREGYRGAESPEPSATREEATVRLLALMPAPPEATPVAAALGQGTRPAL